LIVNVHGGKGPALPAAADLRRFEGRSVNLHGKWFWLRFREAVGRLIAAKIDTRFLW